LDFGCWLTFPTSYIIHTVLYDYCFCCNFVLVFSLSLVIDYGVMDLINCKNNYSNRNGLVLRSILTTLWKKHLMTSHWSSFLLSCLLQEASQQQCFIFLLIFILAGQHAIIYYIYLLSFQNFQSIPSHLFEELSFGNDLKARSVFLFKYLISMQ
jgi:hypothetical protein